MHTYMCGWKEGRPPPSLVQPLWLSTSVSMRRTLPPSLTCGWVVQALADVLQHAVHKAHAQARLVLRQPARQARHQLDVAEATTHHLPRHAMRGTHSMPLPLCSAHQTASHVLSRTCVQRQLLACLCTGMHYVLCEATLC